MRGEVQDFLAGLQNVLVADAGGTACCDLDGCCGARGLAREARRTGDPLEDHPQRRQVTADHCRIARERLEVARPRDQRHRLGDCHLVRDDRPIAVGVVVEDTRTPDSGAPRRGVGGVHQSVLGVEQLAGAEHQVQAGHTEQHETQGHRQRLPLLAPTRGRRPVRRVRHRVQRLLL